MINFIDTIPNRVSIIHAEYLEATCLASPYRAVGGRIGPKSGQKPPYRPAASRRAWPSGQKALRGSLLDARALGPSAVRRARVPLVSRQFPGLMAYKSKIEMNHYAGGIHARGSS